MRKNGEKYKRTLSLIIVLVTFLFMQPYIVWSTYKYYTFFLVVEYLILICGIILICYGMVVNNFVIPKKNFDSFCIFAILALFFYFTGEYSQVGQWGVMLQYVFLTLLMFVDDSVLRESLNKLAFFMSVLLIPALIVLIFRYGRINVPHTILLDYKEGHRIFIQYPLSVATSNAFSSSIASFRLNGMFDEPGALGTYLALILSGRKYDLKNKSNIILFISGCLTFSTAFVIITSFYAGVSIAKRIRKYGTYYIGKRFLGALILGGAIVGVILVINPTIINNVWLKIFSKLFVHDNLRGINDVSFLIKKDFSNVKTLIWGKGYAFSEVFDAGTILMLFYKVGVVGCVMSAIYLVFVRYDSKTFKNTISMRIIMLLLLIQRPYILMLPYVTLFVLGLSNSERIEGKNAKSKNDIY